MDFCKPTWNWAGVGGRSDQAALAHFNSLPADGENIIYTYLWLKSFLTCHRPWCPNDGTAIIWLKFWIKLANGTATSPISLLCCYWTCRLRSRAAELWSTVASQWTGSVELKTYRMRFLLFRGCQQHWKHWKHENIKVLCSAAAHMHWCCCFYFAVAVVILCAPSRKSNARPVHEFFWFMHFHLYFKQTAYTYSSAVQMYKDRHTIMNRGDLFTERSETGGDWQCAWT